MRDRKRTAGLETDGPNEKISKKTHCICKLIAVDQDLMWSNILNVDRAANKQNVKSIHARMTRLESKNTDCFSTAQLVCLHPARTTF